jgi:uncharacterized repeat protein (TIGR03806 family)
MLLGSCGGKLKRPENATCLAFERPSSKAGFEVEQRFSGVGFDDAVALEWPPGTEGFWYVAEQGGRILRFADDEAASSAEVVLDLTGSELDTSTNETGLLGMAFHPNFADNGFLYLNYVADSDGLETRISRFTSSDGGASFDVGSELSVYTVEQPFWNHNAGGLGFGPDGMLYFGLGDGGSGGDPQGNGQNPFTPLAAMLRLDVDGGSPYAIPPDNPWADGVDALPEVYAIGLRNPWRFTFDPATGDLWLGDVGQDEWEEVSRIESGGNYGWNTTEGEKCFSPSSGCDKSGLVPPMAVYPTSSGGSVIGGLVYRGSAIPHLVGTYLYADYYSGDVSRILFDDLTGESEGKVAVTIAAELTHWTYGPDGEAWMIAHNGKIYTLVAKGSAPEVTLPALLSETGCVDPDDPTQPGEALIAYDVAHPLWSDGASKARWLALPDGTTIDDVSGDLDLPIGSVLVKEFTVDGHRIETRLMVRHEDGGWGGYVYAWRDDESDADLLPAGALLNQGTWLAPSRSDCSRCHTEAAGGSLGLEVAQLGEQIDDFVKMDLMAEAEVDEDPLVGPDAGDLDAAMRSYLHVNCSNCHRPDGGARTDLDFRREATRVELGLCEDPKHGDLGVDGAQVISPGKSAESLMYLRMSRRDANQMPPIGSLQVDDAAVARMAQWIDGLSGCE